MIVVLSFHGVCNIKIKLSLQTLPWRLPLYKSVCYSYFPTSINVVFALVSSADRFLESHNWWWSNTDKVAYRKFLRFYFRRQKYKISHDRKALHRLSYIINWVDNVNWPPKRVQKVTFRALALRRNNEPDKGLTFETSAFKLLTVANLRYQLSR